MLCARCTGTRDHYWPVATGQWQSIERVNFNIAYILLLNYDMD